MAFIGYIECIPVAWFYQKMYFLSLMGKSISSKKMTDAQILVVIHMQLSKMLIKSLLQLPYHISIKIFIFLKREFLVKN